MDIELEANMNNKADGYIDTGLIFRALTYYSNHFKMVKVPMCVSFESVYKTLPKNRVPLLRDNLDNPQINTYYVGSAEQSFIEMFVQGKLGKGIYCALTPCQRHEPEDETHFTIFLKLELIIIGEHNLADMLTYVKCFLTSEDVKFEVVKGEEEKSLDINVAGIEVGSYGLRSMPDGTPYTFGTGIAEPRLSFAIGVYNEDVRIRGA